MTEQLYNYSLFAAWVLLFFFSGNLYLGKVPYKGYDAYVRSRKLLGVALLAFGLQIFVQWLFDFRSKQPNVAAALNFTCFYLEAILFGMSFISLLDNHYISRQRVTREFGRYAVVMMAVWGSVLWASEGVQSVVLLLTAVVFFVDASLIAIRFFRTYNRAIRMMENYYSDAVETFVKWLYKSTFGIVVFGLSCSLMAFAPKWGVAVYMVLGIFMFIYIYNSFQNYMLYFPQIETAVVDDDETASMKQMGKGEENDKSDEMAAMITGKLDRWVADKGYEQSGITIDRLASEIGTNRYYMSNYINARKNTTFSQWIAGLRLGEAKRLLRQSRNLSIEQIARKVGYSSGSYFIHQFSAVEKMPPSKWKRKYESSR